MSLEKRIGLGLNGLVTETKQTGRTDEDDVAHGHHERGGLCFSFCHVAGHQAR